MLDLLIKLPVSEKRLTLATLLTLVRAVTIPFIVFAMYQQNWQMAFWLFILASITDFLDGIVARARNEQTILGAALDPIVDKIFILAIYFTLSFVETPLFAIPKWFFLIILIKELLLMFGAVYLFYKNGLFQIKPTFNGKWAMAFQVIFIAWLFSCYFFNWIPVKTYFLMLGLVLWFAFAAFSEYTFLMIRGLFK